MLHRDKMMVEALPPTQGALLQHLNRATSQTSIWTTADQPKQRLPSPERWGWTLSKDSKTWLPFWTTLPMASDACSELVKCAIVHARVPEDVAAGADAEKVDGNAQDDAGAAVISRSMYSRGM